MNWLWDLSLELIFQLFQFTPFGVVTRVLNISATKELNNFGMLQDVDS